MTSRELMLKTLEFKNTDGRVPRDLWTLPWANNNHPEALAKIRNDFEWDMSGSNVVYSEKPIGRGDMYEVGEATDDWGCVFHNIQRGVIGEVKDPQVRDEDWLDAKNVHILILGDKSRLPAKQRDTLVEAETRTAGNTGLHLNIAINYGGRDEIARAAREIAREAADGRLSPDAISEQTISDHLYTRGQPDVDLLIRTSGEMRLSNFLLYQCAYAEFLFPRQLWPDFSVKLYDEALAAFGNRERRFGART